MKFGFIAGFLFCVQYFTSYQGCRFLLNSARSFIQTGLYKGVIAGKCHIFYLPRFKIYANSLSAFRKLLITDQRGRIMPLHIKMTRFFQSQQCKLLNQADFENVCVKLQKRDGEIIISLREVRIRKLQ